MGCVIAHITAERQLVYMTIIPYLCMHDNYYNYSSETFLMYNLEKWT